MKKEVQGPKFLKSFKNVSERQREEIWKSFQVPEASYLRRLGTGVDI